MSFIHYYHHIYSYKNALEQSTLGGFSSVISSRDRTLDDLSSGGVSPRYVYLMVSYLHKLTIAKKYDQVPRATAMLATNR